MCKSVRPFFIRYHFRCNVTPTDFVYISYMYMCYNLQADIDVPILGYTMSYT